MHRSWLFWGLVLTCIAAGVFGAGLHAAEDGAKPAEPARNPRPDPPGLVRLSPDHDVWVDKKNKRVVMVGQVCLREGQMEMFACLKNTKEHESVLAVPTEAFVVHAGLMAVGAEPGNPARFLPKYEPARGTEIGITLYWTDEKGQRHESKAQDWLRNMRTNKPLDQPWVFAGSAFWVDDTTKQRHYQAEEGDFICVSNFSSAMLDLPIESSQANSALLFEAMTERIPPKGTNVTIVLTPKLKGLEADRGGDPKADAFVPAAAEEPQAKP